MSMTTIHMSGRGLNILLEIATVGYMDTPTVWQRFFPRDRTGQSCRRWLRTPGGLFLRTENPWWS